MHSLQAIQNLFDENRVEDALYHINCYIENNENDEEAHFLCGRIHWRMQNYSSAVTQFETACAINPDSQARHALELARDVFDYYNPDLLNP